MWVVFYHRPPLNLKITATQQPDVESSVGPGSAAKPEPSEARQRDGEEKEDEEDEEEGLGQESEREQSLDPEWVEERFRIDRKKLENMLYAPNLGNGETGEEFFERVMRETDTQVKWPSKLKIGAKSKKGDEPLLCSSCVSSLTVAGVVQKSAQTFVEFPHRSACEGGGKRD
ncbi:hypothetical protein fugu_013339 [Takifugu bimaculatus]|uniref:BICC1 first type I KH domain-containing protein n=1 Tax=Takifugu bimaculatus TaxID=433685 RepID=A0A4Z2C2Y0_9TELE|nr:hypothetical protein fugu_013339 [Takifugu bimaculatus]